MSATALEQKVGGIGQYPTVRSIMRFQSDIRNQAAIRLLQENIEELNLNSTALNGTDRKCIDRMISLFILLQDNTNCQVSD